MSKIDTRQGWEDYFTKNLTMPFKPYARLEAKITKKGKKAASPIEVGDKVKLHYNGTLTDGTEFDSTYSRNKTMQFYLGRAEPSCFNEALVGMKKGTKAKLVCPPNHAYGAEARPNIPAFSTLLYDIEIMDVENFFRKKQLQD